VPTTRTLCRFLPAAVLLLSCGGGDLVLPSEGEPATIVIEQGDAQSGRVGNALPEPIVVRVTDTQGRAVVSVPVVFAFTGGAQATVTPDTSVTDADGRVVFQVVLGTQTGDGTAEIRVSTAGGRRTLTAPLQFTALSAAANELTAVSGDSQSAPVGSTLSDPLVVQVTDAFGNPIAGVDITWTPPDGGSVDQATVTTGSDGFAAAQVTLAPTAGVQHTTAAAPGLAGSPVTFTHTALPGAAATVERVSGDGQSAVVGTSVADPLVVRVRDSGGNPVAGLGVTWLVTAGGGSVQPQNVSTGQDGLASTVWTLGPAPGPNTVTAVVSGVGTVAFNAAGQPGAPPSLSIETGPPTTAVRGVALSRAPVVQLREPDGSVRPLAGVRITVGLATAGATLQGTLTRVSGREGRAEFPGLVLAGPPGTYALAFSAPGYTGVVSGGIALARAPTTTEITADDPDPSVAGAAVRVAYRVVSNGGTPAGTVRVTSDDGASCTADVTAGACSLSLTTAGTRTITATYSGGLEFEGSTDTERHEVRAPPPPGLTIVAQPPTVAVVGQPFAGAPVVQLVDAGGSPLQTSGVTVNVAIASGGGTLGGTSASTTGADGRASFPGLSISGNPGPRTLRFSADGYTAVVSDPIDLQAAPPAATSTTIISDQPDPSSPRQPVAVKFTVTSPAGTPAGTVKVTASGGNATCSATVAEGECTLTLVTPGPRTITAAYAGGNGFAPSSDTEEHVVSEPPAPVPSGTTSTVVVGSGSIAVGGSTSVTVTVRDASSAPLPGIAVTLTATGPGAVAPSAPVSTAGDGTAAFAVTGTAEGTIQLTASADGVVLAQQPTITVSKAASTIVITSDDPDPSVPGTDVTVRFEVTGTGGTPTGNVTVTASGGPESCIASVAEKSCKLSLTVPGTRTITASYPGDANFDASAGTATHVVTQPELALSRQPSTAAVSGVALQQPPEVELQDGNGKHLDLAGVAVSVSLAPAGATLSGTLTRTTDGHGRARFDDLAITGAPGVYTLQFSADGFTPATSDSITLSSPPEGTTVTAR
jgi:hypothetical protein